MAVAVGFGLAVAVRVGKSAAVGMTGFVGMAVTASVGRAGAVVATGAGCSVRVAAGVVGDAVGVRGGSGVKDGAGAGVAVRAVVVGAKSAASRAGALAGVGVAFGDGFMIAPIAPSPQQASVAARMPNTIGRVFFMSLPCRSFLRVSPRQSKRGGDVYPAVPGVGC
jgi:hypothetical protein